MEHGRVAERRDAVLARELVGPAGARDDERRRCRRPARGDEAARERGELLAGHVERLGVGVAAGDEVAALRHRRRESDAATGAAPRQRPLRRGGGGERGGDAGDDLALDAGGGERLELFLEAAEDARIAALEADDARAALRVLDEEGVDRVLAGVFACRCRAAHAELP